MINPKELRLSNLIYMDDIKAPIPVWRITKKKINHSLTFDRVFPVPLTEEWLLSIGYKKIVIDREYSLEFEISPEEKFVYNKDESCVMYGILGVSQFHWSKRKFYYKNSVQNIHLDLTGEELVEA